MPQTRSEEAHQKALAAAIAVVAEVGVAGFTVDAVARQSGVAKTTIYRRWKSGDDLLMEALDCSVEPLITPNTGTLRTDLLELYRSVTAMFAQPHIFSTMLGALARAASDPEFRRLTQDLKRERHQPMRTILQLAQARGEIAADADLELMTDFIEGPLAARKILSMGTFDDAQLEQVVDMVVAGLSVGTGPAASNEQHTGQPPV